MSMRDTAAHWYSAKLNKRGQLYIFAALILCVVLFILVGKRVLIHQEFVEDDFEQLSQNYNYESAKFINSLLDISDEAKVGEEFVKFTTGFTSYSKNQNPDFMFIYAFEYNEEVFLGNYLDNFIWIKNGPTGTYEPLAGCFDDINACVGTDIFTTCVDQPIKYCTTPPPILSTGFPIFIIMNGIEYELNVKSGSPEIVIIGRESLGEQRKVYMNNEFVSGEKVADDVDGLKSVIGPTDIDLCNIMHENRDSCKKDDCCWDIQEGVCKEC